MKVVLDTNLLISGSFWSGAPYGLLEAIDNGIIEALISKDILDEYEEIVKREEILDKVDVFQQARVATVRKIIMKFTSLEPQIKLSIVKDDPDDNKFIEAAVEGDAAYIVTRDNLLLKVR